MTKPSPNILRAVALLFLCVTCGVARGQRAYKIDEITYTRCDLSEVPQVTDEPMPIFVELGKHPEAKAAVIVYAELPGEALSYARHVGRWLTKSRGVTAERLFEVY